MNSQVDSSLSAESLTSNSGKSHPGSQQTHINSSFPVPNSYSTFGLPKAITSDPQRFKLDMSFNRHGATINPKRRFACAIDPLALPPAFPPPKPVPSRLVANPSPKEWESHYRKWSFPTRTDSPRGLTWGPYYSLSPSPTTTNDSLSSSSSRGTKRTRHMITSDLELSRREPKRRKLLLPILRLPPCNPLIIRLKLNPNRPVDSNEQLILKKHLPCSLSLNHEIPPVKYLQGLVDLIVSPTIITEKKSESHSRITLCISSQLKYGS
ncbi:hypothetical protein CROQUDRAFT_107644 [Cronartium quercuum f. sp. fusiforme G11]|uniref:Uncharacterized protein n=1 Tax=Cronartium quercuum f. sp. fusiforme G11 TaxID=708437 RepID=A0A9P6NK88_9BASI|nr:hypothetical protein CROQUDRAFT_107644 [Cronartium quercuum f. sp. fusiforme G11]